MPKQKTSRPKVPPPTHNPDHALDMLLDQSAGGEIILVRGGKLAYLWIGQNWEGGACYGTLAGVPRLRRLAEAILEELSAVARKARAAK